MLKGRAYREFILKAYRKDDLLKTYRGEGSKGLNRNKYRPHWLKFANFLYNFAKFFFKTNPIKLHQSL